MDIPDEKKTTDEEETTVEEVGILPSEVDDEEMGPSDTTEESDWEENRASINEEDNDSTTTNVIDNTTRHKRKIVIGLGITIPFSCLLVSGLVFTLSAKRIGNDDPLSSIATDKFVNLGEAVRAERVDDFSSLSSYRKDMFPEELIGLSSIPTPSVWIWNEPSSSSYYPSSSPSTYSKSKKAKNRR
jgi:hypothetical protein